MNDWYEKLLAECGRQHDVVCDEGAGCPDRTQHLLNAYVLPALRDAVEDVQNGYVRSDGRNKMVRVYIDATMLVGMLLASGAVGYLLARVVDHLWGRGGEQ